jgi:hypothetical protein
MTSRSTDIEKLSFLEDSAIPRLAIERCRVRVRVTTCHNIASSGVSYDDSDAAAMPRISDHRSMPILRSSRCK